MEKFETDSKGRNLKKKAYSGVGVGIGLRKNILLRGRTRNRSKNHQYSPDLVVNINILWRLPNS